MAALCLIEVHLNSMVSGSVSTVDTAIAKMGESNTMSNAVSTIKDIGINEILVGEATETINKVEVEAASDAINFALWTGTLAGVVAGIATALLLWIAKIIVVKWLQPTLADLLYKDAEIEGRWKASFSYASLDEHRLDDFVARIRQNERHRLKLFLEAATKKYKENLEIDINEAPIKKTKKDTSLELIESDDKDKKKTPANEFSITLERKGHVVTGTMLSIKGKNEGRHYKISGTFKNLILTATYESTDKKEIERGSLSLMLKHNGKCFYGYIVALDDEEHDLGAARTHWVRN